MRNIMNIKRFCSKDSWMALGIFAIVAIIFCLPILHNLNYWGQMDWDQFTFWNAVHRKTILQYHQFPLWNPYVNGGNVLLAHPHSPFLSPFYIFVLFFGPIVGLKLEIIIHLILGMWGMFFLTRYMKLSRNSSYLASFIYMLSSIYPLHLTEGHTEWLPMAFVPWAFLFYLKSFKKTKYVLGGIFFLALILLAGSVDVFSISVTFISVYALFKTFQIRKIAPIKVLAFIFGGTFLLCSIKLIPMLEFLHQYPRLTNECSGTNLAVLCKMLVSRKQAIYDVLSGDTTVTMGLDYGWHEYGSYVGIVPLLLFFFGIVIKFRERWPLILTGIIFLLIALGSNSPVNLWGILHKFPIYNSLTVPSRFILGFVFCFSLFSGFGLSQVKKMVPKISNNKNNLIYKLLFSSIVLFVLFDLYWVNSPIFKNAFTISPIEVKENITFCQRYDYVNFHGEDESRSSIYPVFMSNSGIVSGYEVINIDRGDILTISNSGYKGEAYLAGNQGSVSVEYFSPNKIVVNVKSKKSDILVLNQNYYRGWRVKKDGKTMRAEPFKGLVSTTVIPGHRKVVFYYMPVSFLMGFFVTGSFILIVLLYQRKNIKKYFRLLVGS